MFDLERWEEIFETIGKNKLRTFLTGLSVLSGIFILIILLGVGEGIKNGLEHEFQKDAENRISIFTEPTAVAYKGFEKDRDITLENEDYDLIADRYADQLEYKSSLYRIWSGFVSYKNESGNYRVEGVLPNYQFLENEEMVDGRFLNDYDQEKDAKVAVIGKQVKEELFKENKASPLGELIKISGVNFKVVGVFSDPGGEREESRVYVPIAAAQNIFNGGKDEIRSMDFTLPKLADFDKAIAASDNFIDRVKKYLKEAHIIAPDDDKAISVTNSLKEAKRIYTITSNVKIFFWFVGIATLLAGIVGVGNVMLIIVKERTMEIGIRKALGAQPWSIITMILHEAVFITAVAGLVGLILGMLLLDSIGPYIQNEFIRNPSVNFQVAISTVIILVFAGALAGFIPAYKAARIKPIEALRDE